MFKLRVIPSVAAAALMAAATPLGPAVAAAAETAFVKANLNIRTGPGTSFDRLGTIPKGTEIEVEECVRGGKWCEVNWSGEEGWVSGYYLAYLDQEQAPLTVSLFYEELEPYGAWVRHDAYGFVWVPDIEDQGWAPYTNGRWVYTEEYGWYFASYDPYGWATYHYGRWALDPDLGWYWVPGVKWAPAWVAWRRAPEYVGWAPLPPEGAAGLTFSVEYTAREIPQDHWYFVPVERFLAPRLSIAVFAAERRPVIFERSEYLGPVTIQNNTVINTVIEVNYIEQQTNQEVVATEIQLAESPDQADSIGEDDRTIRALAVDLAEPEPNAAPSQVLEPEQLVEQRTAPAATEAPAEGTAPAATEAPAEETAPAATEAPAEETAPAATEAPAEETAPAATEAPAEEPAPAATEAPAEETAPAATEAPAEETAPAATEAPAEETAPAATEAPAEETAPAATEAPAEETAPAATEAPAEEPAPAATEAPVEETAPAATEAPVEETAPAATEAPVEETAPAATEAPVEETAPAATEAPVEAQQCPDGQATC
jgi:hypothetical protein